MRLDTVPNRRNGKVVRIKLIVNNLTSEDLLRNREDVVEKSAEHFGDALLSYVAWLLLTMSR